uniref:Uncharacterized protein n=1 Tax=Schistosoma haematobium TaxID=6185 RepID=A0A095C3R1_SCHHA
MVLLFILLGILQGYAHSSAKTPRSEVLKNMNNRIRTTCNVLFQE